MEDVFDFSKIEHKRLITHYDMNDPSAADYTMLAKLMEESSRKFKAPDGWSKIP